jgi:uncharacterized protein (DUF58 family)
MVRTLAFAALWLFVFATALTGGWSVMFKLSYLLLLLYAAAWLWTRASVTRLEVSREPQSERTQVGGSVAERITITNLSWLPKAWLQVELASELADHGGRFATSLGPHAQVTHTLHSECPRRGKFLLGPTIIRSGDPFGICRAERVFPGESSIVVYPETVDLPRLRSPDGDLSGGGQRRERVPYSTAMATSIREYQPGDPFGRIHWPNTARLGKLLVKEFEQDPVSDIWLILDLDRNVHMGEGPDSTEEMAVKIAASVAKHFLLENRAVGLLTQGQVLQPDRGTRQFLKVLELLAVVRVREWRLLRELLVSSEARFARGTSTIIVTPSVRRDWIVSLEDVRSRGVRAAAVLLDMMSFGSTHTSEPVIASLAAASVPTYVVRRGEPLDQALAEPVFAEPVAGAS